MLVSQFSHTLENEGILVRHAIVFKPCVVILLEPPGDLAGVLGQPPTGQGAVRRHGDVLLPTEGDVYKRQVLEVDHAE